MTMKWLLACALLLTVGAGAVDGRQRSLIKTCPEGYELVENPVSGKAECACLPYHLYWPMDGICYREMTQGPCKPGHKLIWNSQLETSECQCPPFWTRLTSDGECYEEYTQGPCQKGQLLIQERCTCSQNLTMHYHPDSGQCFELYTRGPCSSGKVLHFNYSTLRPECVCQEGHVEWDDGNCYPVNTQRVGPCNATQCPQETPISCFVSDTDGTIVSSARCACLPASSLMDNGRCYAAYNQGPCEYGHWFVYDRTQQPAQCLPKKNCQRFDNWYSWPQDGNCYKQWRQGPCQFGELFYLDPETGRTSCQCKSSWLAHLFEGKCYEHHSVGPCPAGQYFNFDPVTKKTGCTCFTAFAPDVEKGICVEKLTQDKCPLGQLITADAVTGQSKCDCQADTMKQNYWPADGKCYQHLTQGPCLKSMLFRLDDQTSLPACLPPIVSSSGLRKKRSAPFKKLSATH
ncbi:uncharacterized protein LOC124206025 [Daphnia pulex]|uniref:uncharacterized protein LOC124206025 n=1 Tax=Daphnia pulex TaxID=6669 RepID=UPI001EDDD865|nr:uncharacterized protein LOC124206025 [Daphnia pulex]